MCIDRELNMDSDFGSLDVFGRSKDIMSSLFSELDGLEEEDKEDTTDFDYESTSYYQIPEESGGLNLDNYLDGLDLSAHSFDENAYDRKMAPRAMHIEPSNPKKRKHSVERKATKVRSIIKSRVLPNIGDMSLHPDYAIVEVISDSEDSEQGSSNNNEENCFDEKKKISRPNKDDLLCSDNNIPATASEIAEFSFSELKSFITENELTKEQNNIVKQIRRRGRNKVAARKTREQRQTQRPEKEDDDSNSNVSASPSSESTQSTSASIPKILPKKKFVPKIEFSDNLMKNSKPLYVIHNVPRIRIIKR
uniref:BZIP_Maf domain-containing protein n=1 Tax=Rhabditophanes sp. KR3021 TaxID=114890 RepID=A0AC35U7G8_9BILA